MLSLRSVNGPRVPRTSGPLRVRYDSTVMKLILILVAAALAVAALVWWNQRSEPHDLPALVTTNPLPKVEKVATQPASRQHVAPTSKSEREEWAALRPPSDANVPDPDDVGPCPPAKLTQNAASDTPIVKRGLEIDGTPIWYHVDGSVTKIAMGTARGQPVRSFVVGRPQATARIDMRAEDPRMGGEAGRAPQSRPDSSKKNSN